MLPNGYVSLRRRRQIAGVTELDYPCTKCGVVKNYLEYVQYRNRKGRSVRTRVCKICRNNYVKNWRKVNPDKNKMRIKNYESRSRNKNLVLFKCRKKLNLSRAWAKKGGHKPCLISLEELIKEYRETCDTCGKFMGEKIAMDHCHATGKFRGFLCTACNCAIGFLQDDVKLLEKMVSYMKGIK